MVGGGSRQGFQIPPPRPRQTHVWHGYSPYIDLAERPAADSRYLTRPHLYDIVVISEKGGLLRGRSLGAARS